MHSRVQKSRHEADEKILHFAPLFIFQWKTFSLIINDPSRWQIIICFMPCCRVADVVCRRRIDLGTD